LLHCTKRCGRAGPAVTWFATHGLLTALRDFRAGPLSLRLHRGGRDSRTLLHCTKRCGRAGPAVTWFATHGLSTALRDFRAGPLSLRLHRGGQHRRTVLHCSDRCLLARQIFGDSASSGLPWCSLPFSSSSR
jgi:hypothetical protein